MAYKKPRETCGCGDAHRSSNGKVEGAEQACKRSLWAKEMGQGSRIHVRVDNGRKVMVTGAKWHLLGKGGGWEWVRGISQERKCQLSFEAEKALRFQREVQRRCGWHTGPGGAKGRCGKRGGTDEHPDR